jgi:hypothetical protein
MHLRYCVIALLAPSRWHPAPANIPATAITALLAIPKLKSATPEREQLA